MVDSPDKLFLTGSDGKLVVTGIICRAMFLLYS